MGNIKRTRDCYKLGVSYHHVNTLALCTPRKWLYAVGLVLTLTSSISSSVPCSVMYFPSPVDALHNVAPDDDYYNYYGYYSDLYEVKVVAGPSLGLAVTAWIFGLAGTIIILTLRIKATTNQDGPCRKFCMPPEQQDSVPLPTVAQSPIPATKGPPPAYIENTV